MRIVTRNSPVAVHFGALDTRLIQLKGGPGGWGVRAYHVSPAQGLGRHAQAAEDILLNQRSIRTRGKDVAVGLSGETVAVSLVPVDPNQRARLDRTLQETAQRSVRDPEGFQYRFLQLAGGGAEASAGRDEYLLLAVGESELRRCNTAADSMRMRPVSTEMNAFPIARVLQAVHHEEEGPWGFLHLGFGHSLFGVVHMGEVRFLKMMQLTGQSLFQSLNRTLSDHDADGGADELLDLLGSSGGTEERAAPSQEEEVSIDPIAVATLQEKAVGHAVEILHSLRMESEALAQEVRACLRHFGNRHKGARAAHVTLTGFGASLPEVANALGNSLGMPTKVATPFTDLGISAPEDLLEEEHLWCPALGLAMRGFE